MTTQTVPTATPASTAGFPTDALTEEERDSALTALMTDGITARRGAFSREFIAQMAEDVDAAFEEARGREGGAVGRGPNRYYVEIHPEALRGFVDLVDHPWVRGVSEAVLGPDYQIVEVGFDIPFAGAVNQPWHRDFPMPRETREEGRLTSLAFNLTMVDTEEDMGPFEIAPGTQWDIGADFKHEMFPDKAIYNRYEERAVRKFPSMGDVSARSALTIHRGTVNHSQKRRPGAGARHRRPGGRQRRAPRHGGHAAVPRVAARAGARAPRLPGGRRADPDLAEAHDRGAGDGRAVTPRCRLSKPRLHSSVSTVTLSEEQNL